MSFHTLLDSGYNTPSIKDGLPTMDDGLAFYISQLAHLESQVYTFKYGNLIYQDLIPIINIPEWADSWDYMMMDGVTAGKFIGASSSDLPMVDVENQKTSEKIFTGGLAYQFSLDELRKASQLRMNLDSAMMEQAVRGCQEHINEVALLGDADRAISGLLNNANITKNVSGSDFSADAAACRAHIQSTMTLMWTNSVMVHAPNVLLLPPSIFSLLNDTPSIVVANGASYISELEYLKMNNIYTSVSGGAPLTIKPVQQLETASATGGIRYMAYELNPQNLSLPIAMSQQFKPPQFDNLMLKVPSEYRFGGVGFRYLGSAIYGDNG